jgi:hypothetical protein
MYASSFLRISFGFFNFSDHSIVHGANPFDKQDKKKAREIRRAFGSLHRDEKNFSHNDMNFPICSIGNRICRVNEEFLNISG